MAERALAQHKCLGQLVSESMVKSEENVENEAEKQESLEKDGNSKAFIGLYSLVPRLTSELKQIMRDCTALKSDFGLKNTKG